MMRTRFEDILSLLDQLETEVKELTREETQELAAVQLYDNMIVQEDQLIRNLDAKFAQKREEMNQLKERERFLKESIENTSKANSVLQDMEVQAQNNLMEQRNKVNSFKEDLYQKLNHTKGRVNDVITKRRKDPNLRAIEDINEALLKEEKRESYLLQQLRNKTENENVISDWKEFRNTCVSMAEYYLKGAAAFQRNQNQKQLIEMKKSGNFLTSSCMNQQLIKNNPNPIKTTLDKLSLFNNDGKEEFNPPRQTDDSFVDNNDPHGLKNCEPVAVAYPRPASYSGTANMRTDSFNQVVKQTASKPMAPEVSKSSQLQPKPTSNQPKLRAGLKRASLQSVSSLVDIPQEMAKLSGDTLHPKDVTENPLKKIEDASIPNDSGDLNKMVNSPPTESNTSNELKNSTGFASPPKRRQTESMDHEEQIKNLEVESVFGSRPPIPPTPNTFRRKVQAGLEVMRPSIFRKAPNSSSSLPRDLNSLSNDTQRQNLRTNVPQDPKSVSNTPQPPMNSRPNIPQAPNTAPSLAIPQISSSSKIAHASNTGMNISTTSRSKITSAKSMVATVSGGQPPIVDSRSSFESVGSVGSGILAPPNTPAFDQTLKVSGISTQLDVNTSCISEENMPMDHDSEKLDANAADNNIVIDSDKNINEKFGVEPIVNVENANKHNTLDDNDEMDHKQTVTNDGKTDVGDEDHNSSRKEDNNGSFGERDEFENDEQTILDNTNDENDLEDHNLRYDEFIEQDTSVNDMVEDGKNVKNYESGMTRQMGQLNCAEMKGISNEEKTLEDQGQNIPPVTSPRSHQEATSNNGSDMKQCQNKIIFSPTSPREGDITYIQSPINPYFDPNLYYAENMMRSGNYAPRDQQQGPTSPQNLNQHQNKNQYDVSSPSMFTGHYDESMERNHYNMDPRSMSGNNYPDRNQYQTGNSINPQFQTGSASTHDNQFPGDSRSPQMDDARAPSRNQFYPGYTSPERVGQSHGCAIPLASARNHHQSNNLRFPTNNNPDGNMYQNDPRTPPMNDPNLTRNEFISPDKFHEIPGGSNIIQGTPMKNQQNLRSSAGYEYPERTQYHNDTMSSMVPPTSARKQHQNEPKMATDYENSFCEEKNNDIAEADTSTDFNYDDDDQEKSFDKDDEGEMEEEHIGVNFNIRSPQSTQGASASGIFAFGGGEGGTQASEGGFFNFEEGGEEEQEDDKQQDFTNFFQQELRFYGCCHPCFVDGDENDETVSNSGSCTNFAFFGGKGEDKSFSRDGEEEDKGGYFNFF